MTCTFKDEASVKVTLGRLWVGSVLLCKIGIDLLTSDKSWLLGPSFTANSRAFFSRIEIWLRGKLNLPASCANSEHSCYSHHLSIVICSIDSMFAGTSYIQARLIQDFRL